MFEKLKDPHIQELAKMILRQVLQFAGGVLVTMGVVKSGTYMAVLEQYESIFGAGIALATAAWMVSRNTKVAMATNVNAFPEVKAIITNPTPAGAALADSIPLPTVVTATDPQAKAIPETPKPTAPAKGGKR